MQERATRNRPINALLGLFREALVALVPVFEAARIPWRDEEAYDQWDDISRVLYDKFVAEPIAWGLDTLDDLHLAPYDMRIDDYSRLSFIQVVSEDLPTGSVAAFWRFATEVQPLDTAEALLLDDHQRRPPALSGSLYGFAHFACSTSRPVHTCLWRR